MYVLLYGAVTWTCLVAERRKGPLGLRDDDNDDDGDGGRKDFCQMWRVKHFSRHLQTARIVECLEIIGCNLKQFDGLT